MKFAYQVGEREGVWVAEHASHDIGPIQVRGQTRDEAVHKLEVEIRYWLEMCPCSAATLRNLEIELIPV